MSCLLVKGYLTLAFENLFKLKSITGSTFAVLCSVFDFYSDFYIVGVQPIHWSSQICRCCFLSALRYASAVI